MAMLGIADGWVFLAYLLCILSSILCVYYGIRHWDCGGESGGTEQKEWLDDETKIDKPL